MSQYPNSYYATSLSQQKDALPTLIDDHECDLCVIGGGFSGLSTAIEAAERGLKVILLEQNIIGWGASGRNGGQIWNDVAWGIDGIEKKYGLKHAMQLWNISQAAVDLIDERIKKFRSQINSIFGGGSGDGGGGGGIKKILPSVLIAIVLLYSAFGIYTVDAQEEAVILRFGKYSITKGPGIHWNPPFVDNRFIVKTEKLFTHTTNSSMLTKDENIVNVEVAVQYKRSNPVCLLLEASAPEDSRAQASEAE